MRSGRPPLDSSGPSVRILGPTQCGGCGSQITLSPFLFRYHIFSTLPFAVHKNPRVHGIRPWATDSSASLGGGAATCDLRERVEHCAGSTARRLSDCEVRGFRVADWGAGVGRLYVDGRDVNAESRWPRSDPPGSRAWGHNHLHLGRITGRRCSHSSLPPARCRCIRPRPRGKGLSSICFVKSGRRRRGLKGACTLTTQARHHLRFGCRS